MMKQKRSEEDLIPLPESSDENESEISDIEQYDASVNNSDQDVMSDSDSEPECFSFSATQESRRQDQKLASRAIKLQKDELKKKRKEIFLQNLKQREEKRQKIESKKLPEHVLANLDEDKVEEPSETVEEEEEFDDAKNLVSIPAVVEEERIVEKEIVTTSGNITFKCKVLSNEAKKGRSIPKRIANFKEEMLYGKRIKREKSYRDVVLKKEKQQSKVMNKVY